MNGWIEPVAIAATVTTCSAVSAAVLYGTFGPQSGFWGRNLWHGTRSAPPRVALTFDDGPTSPFTEEILDLLGELEVPAAFFVIGANAERQPELIRRMDAAGHCIGNHSYDHPRSGFLRLGGYWREQLRRTDEVLWQLIGKRPAMFRPPLGYKTRAVVAAARANGQHLVTWSRRAMDGVTTTPERILSRLVPRACGGDILTMHDGVEPHRHRDPRATIAAVRPLVRGLRDRGFTFVPLGELLGLAPYAAEPA